MTTKMPSFRLHSLNARGRTLSALMLAPVLTLTLTLSLRAQEAAPVTLIRNANGHAFARAP